MAAGAAAVELSGDVTGADVVGTSEDEGGAAEEVTVGAALVVGAADVGGADVLGCAARVNVARGATTRCRVCVAEADAWAEVLGSHTAGWVPTWPAARVCE